MSSRPIERLIIEGFKSIKKADLHLKPLNIFIGANGAGKSNLIKALTLLNSIVSSRLQLYVGQEGGADDLLYFGRKQTESIRIKAESTPNAYECVLVPSEGDTLVFSSENCFYTSDDERYKGRGAYNEYVGSGHKESKMPERAQRFPVIAHTLDTMKHWLVYHFHDTSSSAKVRLTGDINDNRLLRPDASNLAAYLYFLKKMKPIAYQGIVSVIKQTAPFIDDFDLRPSSLNPDKILLEWKHTGSDKYFGGHALSDGTLRFICLATLLMQPEPPSTIIIDEPELGLHPAAIQLVAELLKSATAEKKTQVIASTQSVTFVNHFDPQDIVVVDRMNDGSTFTRLNEMDKETWLEDYTIGELWEKNVIGGRP